MNHMRLTASNSFARLWLYAAGAVLTACAQGADAAQFVPVLDGDTAVVNLSIKDHTRIKLEGGRIIGITGDVFDAEKNPEGRIAVEKDTDDGELYVKPISQPMAVIPLRPVKIDIKTSKGKFGLLLTPIDVPADTIILQAKGKARPAMQRGASLPEMLRADEPTQGTEPIAKSGTYLKSIKGFMLAMATNTVPPEVDVQQVGQVVKLWREARLVMRDQWSAQSWIGQRYKLTNVSAAAMVLDERELYSDGVIAVSIKKHQLEVNEATDVLVLRQRPASE
jgi:conjugal transfer pilus assembly protein TraK